MSIGVRQLSLGISFDHPLVNDRAFPAAVQDLVDVVPGHGVNLSGKLMLHFLVLVLRLLGQARYIRRDIPSPDHKISAASNQHIVFAVVDVNHV